MGWYLGHKGLLCLSRDNVLFFIFAHFSKFSIYSWRKKGKMLVFTRCMYVGWVGGNYGSLLCKCKTNIC